MYVHLGGCRNDMSAHVVRIGEVCRDMRECLQTTSADRNSRAKIVTVSHHHQHSNEY